MPALPQRTEEGIPTIFGLVPNRHILFFEKIGRALDRASLDEQVKLVTSRHRLRFARDALTPSPQIIYLVVTQRNERDTLDPLEREVRLTFDTLGCVGSCEAIPSELTFRVGDDDADAPLVAYAREGDRYLLATRQLPQGTFTVSGHAEFSVDEGDNVRHLEISATRFFAHLAEHAVVPR